jgi:hypothetical protein
MASVITVPFGPARVDLIGVRAGDRNLMTAKLVSGGAPLDLAGVTISSQARLLVTTPDPPAISALVEVTDEAGGEFTIRWPGDDVRDLLADQPTWQGVWDLQIAQVGADPLTICAGAFVAEMDVTR